MGWYITYLKAGSETYHLNYFKRRKNTGTSVSEHCFSKLMLKTQRLKAPYFQLSVTTCS